MKNPCLVVACKCGSVFWGMILQKDCVPGNIAWNDLVNYIKKGYQLTTKDASEFTMEACKCK